MNIIPIPIFLKKQKKTKSDYTNCKSRKSVNFKLIISSTYIQYFLVAPRHCFSELWIDKRSNQQISAHYVKKFGMASYFQIWVKNMHFMPYLFLCYNFLQNYAWGTNLGILRYHFGLNSQVKPFCQTCQFLTCLFVKLFVCIVNLSWLKISSIKPEGRKQSIFFI